MSSKYLNDSGLAYFWTKIKAYVAGLLGSKADDADVVHKAGDENITGTKTFVGSKKIAFKQSAANDKLGFTLYNNSNVEKGYLEYNPTNQISGVPLMTLGNYATAAAGRAYVGFRKYSSISGANGAYNLLAPLISDAKAPFNLTTTYTNFFLTLGVTDGTTTVVTDKSGLLDLSSFNAATASALATARSISAGNLEFQGSANFDGSGNIVLNVTNHRSIVSVGNANNYPFHRIAYVPLYTGSWNDRGITFLVSKDFQNGGYGIARIIFRTNNAASQEAQCSVQWLCRTSDIAVNAIQVGFVKTAGASYLDVFYHSDGTYHSAVCRVLAHANARDGVGRGFTVVSASTEVSGTTATDPKTSVESYKTIADAGTALHSQAYTDIIAASDVGVVGNAATASAIAWSGVTGKPTTIAGYGITDAKIDNGTITLGSNSITPLTSHQDISGKVNKSGDTMTGGLTITNNNVLKFKHTGITRGTAPSTNAYPFFVEFRDNADKPLGGLYYEYFTNKTAKTHLMCYQGTTNADTWNSIGIGYDASGNVYTWAPTPATSDYSAKIATTEFVKAQGYLTSHQSLVGKMTRGSYERIEGTSSAHKDLNNYTIAGFYNVKTVYVDNCPSSIGIDAVLLVYPWNVGSYCTQELTESAASSNVRRWVRKCNALTDATPTSWSSWKQVAFIDSNIIGNAATATKLSTARTISLSDDITGSSSFDGSSNITISATRRSCLVGQNDSTVTNPWYKVASYTVQHPYRDSIIVFFIENTYYSDNFGILRVRVRSEADKEINTNVSSIKWLCCEGFDPNNFVLVLPSGSDPTAELWTSISLPYTHRRFTVLSEGDRVATGTRWVLYNQSSAGSYASIPTAGTQLVSQFVGTVSFVNNRIDLLTSSITPASPAYSTTSEVHSKDGATLADSYVARDTYGFTGYMLRAKPYDGNNDNSAYLSLWCSSDGSNKFCTCPTSPDLTANSDIIVTTAWLRRFLSTSFEFSGEKVLNDANYWNDRTYLDKRNVTSDAYWDPLVVRDKYDRWIAAFHCQMITNSDLGTQTGWYVHVLPPGNENDPKHFWINIWEKNGSYTTYSGINADHFRPSNGVYTTLGEPGTGRWGQIYSTNATISTSDERQKSSIEALAADILDAWDSVSFVQFKFSDAVFKKGEAARFHAGVVAQSVERVFSGAGLDVRDYGFFCYDQWDAVPESIDPNTGAVIQPAVQPGDEYSIRYEELLCIEAAYQRRENARLKKRIADLEERLAALELRVS